MTSLVSYTLPCHKREADLMTVLPSVIAAANHAPPVEIVIVDYGCEPPLVPLVWPILSECDEGVSIRTKRVEAQHFHMAQARNIGIREARGQIVVAFLADQVVDREFFADVRQVLGPGMFLKWQETFAFHREDILAARGFDERFEFYGPEGKELADRLVRRGLTATGFPAGSVTQIRTPNPEKTKHYRLPLSKREMHERGMAIWRENIQHGVTVANQGAEWGQRG
jgi:hypothetical protein